MLNRSLLTTLCILSCLVFARQGHGQNCDSLLSLTITDTNRIYVTAETTVTRRELNKNRAIVEAQLLTELREAMASKVLLDVKTTTKSGVFESGETHISLFNSETEIVSTASITEGEVKYCVDEKNKMIYGIFSLNRKETALKTLKDCENRMLRLLAEVRSESETSDISDPEKYQARFDNIKRDSRVVVYLDHQSDMSFLNTQMNAFLEAFNAFKQTSNRGEFNVRFQEIEDEMAAQNYSSGLRKLQALMLDYPNRNELKQALVAHERRFAMFTDQKVRNDEALGNYADALGELDDYCAVVSCTSDDYNRIKNLREAYFQDELSQLNYALKAGESTGALVHFSTLKTLASANPKAYQKAASDYNFFLVKTAMNEVETDLYRKNYLMAFAKVKQIETIYGSDYSELQSLKRTAGQKLLSSEVKQEKQNRRKLFSVGLGVSAFSNTIESVDYLEDEIRMLTFSYEVGLYKKFNYKQSGNSYFSRRSDFIGLRYRLIDYGFTTTINSDAILTDRSYRYDSELALDGTIFRGFHYSAGVLFENRQIIDKPIFTGEAGFNLPVYPFSIQLNVRAVFYKPETVYTLSGGIMLHLDFWRKFNKNDRKEIQRKFGI